MEGGIMAKREIGPKRPAGQPTDSNRSARREMQRQVQRQQQEDPWRRVARNGFGGDC